MSRRVAGAVAVLAVLALVSLRKVLNRLRAHRLVQALERTNTLSFDYIVVGAGSAGCVVASRLSELRDVKVLLLEAGGDGWEDTEVVVPAAVGFLQRTDKDWQNTTIPCPHTNNRIHHWPSGKILGGSSCLNYMLWVRGNKEDYNLWETMGCSGWGYKDVLPYFIKSETCQSANVMKTPNWKQYHGTSGPIHVSDMACPNPLSVAFVESAMEVGIPYNGDANGETQDGVSHAQFNITQGKRNSTGLYLQLAKNRPNLTVLPNAHVLRVVFDKDNKAIGVSFTHSLPAKSPLPEKYPYYFAYCTREVVISAGAVGSAHILLKSGIGPKEQLQQMKMPLLRELPVGLNMQDHLSTVLLFECLQPLSYGPHCDTLWNQLKYILFKSGPAVSQGLEAMSFHRTGTRPDLNMPDLQIHFVCGYPDDISMANANIPNLPVGKIKYGFAFLPTILHPLSKGSVKLRSPHLLDSPLIHPNYLAEPTDMELLVRGFKLCRKIAQAKKFSALIGKECVDTSIPFPPESDQYIMEYIRRFSITIYHPGGTCRMGNGPNTVVAPDLKVHGMNGIRVADASIIPELPSGNTNAPAIMIGEKASDLIKKTFVQESTKPSSSSSSSSSSSRL